MNAATRRFTRIAVGIALVSAASFTAGRDTHGEHHGIGEICKAFPAPEYQRPVEYRVERPDGSTLASGGCT